MFVAMLMKYAFLHALLTEAEAYEAVNPSLADSAELANFGYWLTQRTAAPGVFVESDSVPSSPITVPPAPPADADLRRLPTNDHETVDSEIGALLTFVYRYVRSYARLGLEDSPLTTFDDFTYLATLFGHEPTPLTKSALTEHNIQEKATGIEVIRRLLRQGFIVEEAHPTDKRAKNLRLTPSGRAVLFTSFERMSQVAKLSAAPLSHDEKHTFLRLLRKLDHFHHPLFAASRADSIETLVARHLPPPVS
jgi:MarR family transcriptional regulator, lower aerobic nicotinate degradation pathway regulator